jgi:hypothetical protein
MIMNEEDLEGWMAHIDSAASPHRLCHQTGQWN